MSLNRPLLEYFVLAESEGDVLMEIDLPFWVYPEDVDVRFLPDSLQVSVRNELRLSRTYWQPR